MTYIRRLILSFALLMVAALLIAAAPFVQPEDPSDLNAVLVWLAAGPGALFVANAALAFLYENIPGWGSVVPPDLRPWLVLGMAVLLTFAAQAALVHVPAGVFDQVADIYKTIFMVVSAWLGSQVAYGWLKSKGLRAERPPRF